MEYTGVIKYIRYYSEQTKYIVANVMVEQENETITMTGYMTSPSTEEKYRFVGDYVVHPKYGKQFNFTAYSLITSDDEQEIIRYLSSSLFKGIGKKQASLIVEALGKDAISLIKEDKHVLDGIKGMSKTKRDNLYAALIDQDYDQEVLALFINHGISTRNLTLIQETYKEKTLEVLTTNPYQLADDIEGIGFKSADQMALKLGFKEDDPKRLKAAVNYCLRENCFDSGSTYQLYDAIYRRYSRTMNDVSDERFDQYLDECIQEGTIIQDGDGFYPYDLYHSEEIIVQAIKQWLREDKEEYKYVDREIEVLEKDLSIHYDETQKEAIKTFIREPLMLLTGGPGTGKTTIIQGLLKIYQSLHPSYKIALVAPTGRAAKRLARLTGFDACTIHRLLKWDLQTNTFAMNEENPLDYDLLIIDEFSMVDSLLFANLIKASGKVSKLLIVGDDQQLPSVSPGTLLKEMLSIEEIPKVVLNTIYRQSKQSGIIQLAHHLREDNYDASLFNDYDDLYFLEAERNTIVARVKMVIQKAIDEGYDENDIQVLAPMYQGIAGIDAFNESLQKLFNPPGIYKNELKVGKRIFREGDKVLQLKNRVDDNVFNGDIGYIIEIDIKDNINYLEDKIVVDFEGSIVEYTSGEFNTITHAYCISIHKAQGNEFPIVIMAVLPDYYVMLKKNLLYTGITRAKRRLFIVGSHPAFVQGINNNQDDRRLTSLKKQYDKPDISLYDF